MQVLTSELLRDGFGRNDDWIGLPDRREWDLYALLFTSGTTGPSKAVEVSHHFLLHASDWWSSASVCVDIGESDAFLCDVPLAHMGALAQCLQMVRLGGRIDVRTRPNLQNYWSVARATGSTFSILLSTMAEFIRSQPPSTDDRDHRLRAVLGVPVIRDTPEFITRFGIDHVVTAYGSTETGIPILRTAAWDVPERSCGQLLPGVEGRIADAHDVELPPNTPGELLLRRSGPWPISWSLDSTSSSPSCRRQIPAGSRSSSSAQHHAVTRPGTARLPGTPCLAPGPRGLRGETAR